MAVGNLVILAQSRHSSTIASIYSPADGVRAVIRWIITCNTSGGASDYQLCIDDDGTTYDESTAIAWNVALGDAGQTVTEVWIPMNNTSANFAAQSGTNQAHTTTLIGEEFTV